MYSMKKPEIVKHKGVDIVYLNFTNMKDVGEICKLEDLGGELIQTHKFNSVRTLTNMEGMFFNNEVRNHFSKVVKANGPYVKSAAVIGLTGLISIMYKSFITITGRNIKLFKTKDEAIEYLANT